jgi:hypothetical protein
MYAEVRYARRYPFVATAEVQGSDGVRSARVLDLSIAEAQQEVTHPPDL